MLLMVVQMVVISDSCDGGGAADGDGGDAPAGSDS